MLMKILSASEMKQVRGGAVASSMCASGEQLYTCVTIWEGGSYSSGSVCASSGASARAKLIVNYHNQDVRNDVANVRCL